MKKKQTPQWHALDACHILTQLKTDSSKGLTHEEASLRLQQSGKNKLPEKKRKPTIIRFLSHFNDILVYVLFGAAIVTACLHHYVDTVVILLVTVVNAFIGFIQENKAEKALADIRKLLSLKAKVVRDGIREEIDAEDLVVGDIVLLSPGDKVPADLRLLHTSNLKLEESPLTGEAVPSEKHTQQLEEDTMLGDRYNMAFSSTTVSAGTATGVVVAIGSDTEIGKINQMIHETENITTPLIRQTTQFGKWVSIIIVGVAALVFLFGYFFRNYELPELLLSTIGLAVAAIPEGLPAILSIILAIGVQNMARRNAIIRNLPSVETLGSVSVICSDKTGTLTKNEMTVQSIRTYAGKYEVSGTGYKPEGTISKEGKEIDYNTENDLERLVDCFNTCNEAAIGHDHEGHWHAKGEPTEAALVTLYQKAKFEHKELNRISTIPFDSEYKYMATLVEKEEDYRLILIKGAPDKLFDMAEKQRVKGEETDFDRTFWENQISYLAKGGQRVIGAAYKKVSSSVKEIEHHDIHDGIVFLGLAGIIDPPREEAIEAISACRDAGITVKMITGDHAETAKAIASQMGINNSEKAIEGRKLEQMSDEELQEAVKDCNVFARTSPEHKLRLVNAIRANGNICAMTGDGVNDAPALKRADVGIAMGIKGTEVTKDAAEMVLADDNFATIVAAVEEGRRVYDNLRKTILFILPTNGAEAFLIIASILFGTMIPLTPVQILWVNMVTSVTVSLALAFEGVEKGAMKRAPRSPKEPLLGAYFIWRILFVSIIIGGGTLLMNLSLLADGMADAAVKTITIQTIVIAQLFHLFNNRSIRGCAINKDFFKNKAVFAVALALVGLQLSITYLPFMQSVFGTVSLTLEDWKYPVIIGFAVFVIVEIEKTIMRGIDKRKTRLAEGT